MAAQIGDTKLINMATAKSGDDYSEFERVGFVFPVYGFTMPNIVRLFISGFHFTAETYYFCIFTLGAFALGAAYRTQSLAEASGGKLNYMSTVHMPENYILFSRVPSDGLINRQLKSSFKRIAKIAADIASKAEKRPPRKSLLNALFDKKVADELPKLRFAAKGFSVNEACILCGQCIQLCPVGNIAEKGGKITFDEHCECCLLCMHICPKRAINAKNVTPSKKRYINPNVNISEMKEY
jgi:ferredoxin